MISVEEGISGNVNLNGKRRSFVIECIQNTRSILFFGSSSFGPDHVVEES